MEEIYFSDSKRGGMQPVFVGHETCAKGHSFGPYVREHHIVHFCLGGRGRLTDRHGVHSISGGELFVIRAGEVTTYTADTDEPWEYVWIAFTGDCTEAFSNARSVYDTPAELDSLLYGFIKRGDTSVDIYTSILYALTYYLFSDTEREPQDEKLRHVHRYIKYNYMKDITVSGLAAEFGFERSYLYRMFKRRYGVGPKQYLTRVRMNNARRLLADGYSVNECAYMVGYPDAFSFSRAYKSYFGIAPSLDDIF